MSMTSKEIEELAKSIAHAYVSREEIQKTDVTSFINIYLDVYEAAKKTIAVRETKRKSFSSSMEDYNLEKSYSNPILKR